MKTLSFTLVLLLLSFSSLNLIAGPGDPVSKIVFSNYPNNAIIPLDVLEKTMKSQTGETIKFPITEKVAFQGKVVSNEYKYSNLQTMIIRGDQHNKTLFQLSKIINDDKTVLFSGRIINSETAEVFEIKKDAKGDYHLQKIGLDKILQDCSY